MTAGSRLAESVTLSELDHDPHPVLARLRSEAPIGWVPALAGWLVTSRELAVAVMADAQTFTVDDPRFSTARVVGPSMLSQDGVDHVRHREPFAAAFRPAQVRRRFAGIVAAQVDALVSAMAANGSAEVRKDLAAPLSVAVMCEALGLPDVDPGQLLDCYTAIVAAVGELSAGRPPAQASGEAFAWLRCQVELALAHGDTSSLLVAAHQAGMSAEEVVSNAAVLLFGGIETTEAMLANAVAHLLANPAQCRRLRADPALLDNAITESLRLEPAAAQVDRYATEDVSVGQARVSRGELVIVSLAAANRDPAVFDDPDRFDVGRANADAQLAFAHGRHFCLGAHVARLEVSTALRALLERFPLLRLSGPDQPRPRGLIFRKPDAVPLRWD